jgi:hypothetical protein
MNVGGKETKTIGILREPTPLQVMIDQKELENVEYLNCLGSIVTIDCKMYM